MARHIEYNSKGERVLVLSGDDQGLEVPVTYPHEVRRVQSEPTLSQETAEAARERGVSRIKVEAMRRIIAIIPEWKQRNLTAQAAQLLRKGEANWTAEDTAAWDAGDAVWAQVSAIRAASDALEASDPLPIDVTDNIHWPEF